MKVFKNWEQPIPLFVDVVNLTVLLVPIGCKNKNAVHLWLPGYTFSQKNYTSVTSPLRMHIKINPIQRNGRCGLSCARNLILTAYLPDIWSIYCWSHGFVQCALIETRVIHLIYEFYCIFSFLYQIFANRVFIHEFNLLQSPTISSK